MSGAAPSARQAVSYTLTRSRRKTIAIYVRDGGVEVRAPLRAAKRDIDGFVAAKEKWIADKLAVLRVREAQRQSFSLAYGDRVTYRGQPYLITARDGGRAGFDGQRFYMPPGLTPEQIKAACVHIYRALAKRDLTERTRLYARRMSVMPASVKISGAKTRWGSCSAKKNINYAWRLIMADDDVIDYIVVHELAHLTELNHSPRFWAIVAGVLPDYAARKAKLKAFQEKLGDWADL